MTGPRGRRAVVGATALAMASCGGIPESVLEQGRERRLEAVGVESFDTTDSFDLAGMSATRLIEVEPLDVRKLDGDTVGPAYLAFHTRCSACHAPPAPGSKTASLWSGVMNRMSDNQEDAGLMPMRPGEKALVLEFLQRHAKPAW